MCPIVLPESASLYLVYLEKGMDRHVAGRLAKRCTFRKRSIWTQVRNGGTGSQNSGFRDAARKVLGKEARGKTSFTRNLYPLERNDGNISALECGPI